MRLIIGLLLSVLLASLAAGEEGGGRSARERLEAALRQYVSERGPWRADQVEVGVISFRPEGLEAGKVKVRIIRPGKGATAGLQGLLLGVSVAGKAEKEIWVRARIKIFDEVVVSARPLAYHEIVSAEDVRLERREIGTLYARPLTEIGEALGKQTTRALRINEILTTSQVELPTVVRRGSAVMMRYESSGLRVEAPGQALEEGKVGDNIRVKNPSSGKVLGGVVIDGRTVRVN